MTQQRNSKKGGASNNFPPCTTLYCCPCFDFFGSCCAGCFCEGLKIPFFYYCFPCCCCICAPYDSEYEKLTEVIAEEKKKPIGHKSEPLAPQSPPPKKPLTSQKKRQRKKRPSQSSQLIAASKKANESLGDSCKGTPPVLGDIYTKENKGSKPTGFGAYLFYDTTENGRIYFQWLNKPPTAWTGCLAYIATTKSVSQFSLSETEKVLATNLQKSLESGLKSDHSSFYEAWVNFINLAKTYEGKLIFLPASCLQPPPRLFFYTIDYAKKEVLPMKPDKYHTIGKDQKIGIFTTISMQRIESAPSYGEKKITFDSLGYNF